MSDLFALPLELAIQPPPDDEEHETLDAYQLPEFPLCRRLRAHVADTVWLACADILVELDFKNPVRKLAQAQRLAGFDLEQLTPNWLWDGESWTETETECESESGAEREWCLPVLQLESFVIWSQHRTRKTLGCKARLLRKFGIAAPASLRAPVEVEILEQLQRVLPVATYLQYPIVAGNRCYRLDAYFPELCLAVEIDEGGHAGGYDLTAERERDQALRQRGIVCLRFNPDLDYPGEPWQELLRRILERMLSPDYQHFFRHRAVEPA